VKPTVYTVQAFRWGDADNHSYIVGVYPKKRAALKAAETEEAYRGGKYDCEVKEWTLGEGIEGRTGVVPKLVKELPNKGLPNLRRSSTPTPKA